MFSESWLHTDFSKCWHLFLYLVQDTFLFHDMVVKPTTHLRSVFVHSSQIFAVAIVAQG